MQASCESLLVAVSLCVMSTKLGRKLDINRSSAGREAKISQKDTQNLPESSFLTVLVLVFMNILMTHTAYQSAKSLSSISGRRFDLQLLSNEKLEATRYVPYRYHT